MPIIRDAVKQAEGKASLTLPQDIERFDGSTPSDLELLALAAAALHQDPQSRKTATKLGAQLLSTYAPSTGWQDGMTNWIALQAMMEIFSEKLPQSVTITLSHDDKELVSGTFDQTQLRDLMILSAPLPEQPPSKNWTLTSSPPAAGLGFMTTWSHWVPVSSHQDNSFAKFKLETPKNCQQSTLCLVSFVASVPRSSDFTIQFQFPTGVVPHQQDLQTLTKQQMYTSFLLTDESLTLTGRSPETDTLLQGSFHVTPSHAGSLWSGIGSLTTHSSTLEVPPEQWTILPSSP